MSFNPLALRSGGFVCVVCLKKEKFQILLEGIQTSIHQPCFRHLWRPLIFVCILQLLKIIWNLKTPAFFPLFCSIFCSLLREMSDFFNFHRYARLKNRPDKKQDWLTDWLLVTGRCTLHPVAHSTSICWQMSWRRTPTLGITKNVPRFTFSIPKRRKNRIPLKISSFFQPPRNAKVISRSPQALVTAIDVLYEDWQVWVYIVFFWIGNLHSLWFDMWKFWPNWLDFDLHYIAQSKTHDIQCQYRHLTIPVLVNFLPQLQHVSAPGPGSSLSGCLAEWWSLVGWPYLCPKTIKNFLVLLRF